METIAKIAIVSIVAAVTATSVSWKKIGKKKVDCAVCGRCRAYGNKLYCNYHQKFVPLDHSCAYGIRRKG